VHAHMHVHANTGTSTGICTDMHRNAHTQRSKYTLNIEKYTNK